ncbi:MAG: DUF1501 domain-containing protein [Planctomycetota bacterium]|nr:DUF1501 domain-containing protein [Planctomycetota bacterium]
MSNRRHFLQLGISGLAVSGMRTLTPEPLLANPSVARPAFGKARNVIVMFTWGGMSHIDTFDMKPESGVDIRGSFSQISTSIPGTKICEYLPKMSKMLHELTIVRSVHHTAGDHRKAAYWNITGHAPAEIGAGVAAPTLPSRNDWPSIGAQVAMAMKNDKRYARKRSLSRVKPEDLAEDSGSTSLINWDILNKLNSASLSTDILKPGHYSVGTFNAQDGYSNDSTVELIGMISRVAAAKCPVTREVDGLKLDFSDDVSGDGTAGDWGCDTHGRGGNLWLIGDRGPNEPQAGFGCHANKFITFNMEEIRKQHFNGTKRGFVLATRFGVCGNPGVHPTAAGTGGIWVDGKLACKSKLLGRDDPSVLLEAPIHKNAKFVTMALLNGDSSTFYDDLVFADPRLIEVEGELPPLPERQEPVELEPISVDESLAANLPRCISLPYPLADRGLLNGQYGGFLGLEYDPVFVHPGEGTKFKGKSPLAGTINLAPQGVSRRRIATRSLLLENLNRHLDWEDRESGPALAAASQELAFNMMLSPEVQDAFDLGREPKSVRKLYGDHVAGKSAMLARRLTDAGIPLVFMNAGVGDLNGAQGDNWDTHGNNFNRLKNDLLPPWDHSAHALLTDLIESGRIEDTLVVFLTEFGRTPRINASAGRDHFPSCYTVSFAGAGIQRGRGYGKSDSTASEPAELGCSPADIHATIFHALGIPPSFQIHDAEDRPLIMCDGSPLDIFA